MKKLLMVAVLAASFMSMINAKTITIVNGASNPIARGLILTSAGAPIEFDIPAGTRRDIEYGSSNIDQINVIGGDGYSRTFREVLHLPAPEGGGDFVSLSACANTGVNSFEIFYTDNTDPNAKIPVLIGCISGELEKKEDEEIKRGLTVDTDLPISDSPGLPRVPSYADNLSSPL